MTAQPKNTAPDKSDRKASQPSTTGQGASITQYLQGVKAEWHKISWPTRMQLWQMTLTVLVMVFFLTTLIWAIDNILHYLIQLIVPAPPVSH